LEDELSLGEGLHTVSVWRHHLALVFIYCRQNVIDKANMQHI